MAWRNAAFTKPTNYSLHVDPKELEIIRFVKRTSKDYSKSVAGVHSSSDINSGITAILTAQTIMRGLKGKLQVRLDDIFDGILKRS